MVGNAERPDSVHLNRYLRDCAAIAPPAASRPQVADPLTSLWWPCNCLRCPYAYCCLFLVLTHASWYFAGSGKFGEQPGAAWMNADPRSVRCKYGAQQGAPETFKARGETRAG